LVGLGAILATGAGLLVGAPQATAAASQAGGVLTITGTFGPDFIEADVAADNTVTIYNAPGVAAGTTFPGVSRLVINSENNDDTIDLKIEGSIAVDLDTSSGADSIKVEVLAGFTGTKTVSINAWTATNSDTLEITADSDGANLDLSAFHSMSTNDDKAIMVVNGEGRADWLKAKLRTADSQSQDSAELIVTSDATNVSVDMGVNPTVITQAGTGQQFTYYYGLVSSKVSVDHKFPGTLTANLATLAGSNVVELKGDGAKVLSGSVRGGSGNDSLEVFTQGSTSGSLVLDGSSGYDSCKTTFGSRINCEAL
jgi:hypothetical protein